MERRSKDRRWKTNETWTVERQQREQDNSWILWKSLKPRVEVGVEAVLLKHKTKQKEY